MISSSGRCRNIDATRRRQDSKSSTSRIRTRDVDKGPPLLDRGEIDLSGWYSAQRSGDYTAVWRLRMQQLVRPAGHSRIVQLAEKIPISLKMGSKGE